MNEPSDNAAGKVTGTRVLVTIAACVIVVAGMRAAQSILVPFLASAFLAVICFPPLKWLQDRRVPTVLALLIVVAAMAAVLLTTLVIIGASVNDFIANRQTYQENVVKLKTNVMEWLEEQDLVKWLEGKGFEITDDPEQPGPEQNKNTDVPDEPGQPAAAENGPADVADKAEQPGARELDLPRETRQPWFDPQRAVQLIFTMIGGLGSVFSNGFVVLLTLVFILLEASGFPNKLRAISSSTGLRVAQLDRIRADIRRYVAIKTMLSLATGVLITIWLKLFGVEYAVLWGFLAFLLNYVPNIGSIIAAIPAVLVALIGPNPSSAIYATLGYLLVNGLIGNVIEPRVMGRGLGLSTLVVFLSLVFWGWVLGPIGMLLSVPLTMIAKIALENTEDLRWIAILLSSEGAVPSAERSD